MEAKETHEERRVKRNQQYQILTTHHFYLGRGLQKGIHSNQPSVAMGVCLFPTIGTQWDITEVNNTVRNPIIPTVEENISTAAVSRIPSEHWLDNK